MIPLTRTDAARNMARFYILSVQEDLFGSVTLTREWGRIGQGGRVRVEAYNDEAAAMTAAARITAEKQRRGYVSAD